EPPTGRSGHGHRRREAGWTAIAQRGVALTYSSSFARATVPWRAISSPAQSPTASSSGCCRSRSSSLPGWALRRRPAAGSRSAWPATWVSASPLSQSWPRPRTRRNGRVGFSSCSRSWVSTPPALWRAISIALPHGGAPWTRLVPGALFLGAGAELMHLVSVYYLSGKIESSSELYGGLGAAATLLLGLYLVARLIVAAALLNATL